MFANCIVILALFATVKSAKVLVVVPTPSISHQVVFRPLTQELVSRHHEVTVLTTDPIYPEGGSPKNLREINLNYLCSTSRLKLAYELAKTKQSNLEKMTIASEGVLAIFKEQLLKDKSVANLIADKTIKFDLIIVQTCVPATLIFSYIFDAPVVFMSTFGALPGDMDLTGSETHPLVYPTHYHGKIYNRSIWDEIRALDTDVTFNNFHKTLDGKQDKMLRSVFGTETPPLSQLKSNIHMLFLNVHPIWLHNQPVSPNVVYIWGIHKKSEQLLPQELQSYLDSSKHGVIYISFGSIFRTSAIPPEILEIFVKVFSRLPYDVLWKWDADELPGKSDNIRISKWFPQTDILRHPNLKLFITHGGLQSTDEAINSGVPLIGIPQFSDQEYNTEKYVHFKIGVKLDYTTLSIEKLETAINTIFSNYNSYKKNIIWLRTLMHDQPQPALDRAIWRIEYLLRNGGVQHLRAPAANMSWIEYYELELVLLVLTGIITLGTLLLVTIYTFYKNIKRFLNFKKIYLKSL